MNVDRMRARLDDARMRAAARERSAWLASLDPDHRRVHENAWFMGCSRCLTDGITKGMSEYKRLLTRLEAERRP